MSTCHIRNLVYSAATMKNTLTACMFATALFFGFAPAAFAYIDSYSGYTNQYYVNPSYQQQYQYGYPQQGGYYPSTGYGNTYPLDHNLYSPQTFQLTPSRMYVPQSYSQAGQYTQQGQYPMPGGYGYGNYGAQPYYGGYNNGGYYGGGYGSGYGPYLPSNPPYDSGYASYSNYYRAYPQVPHYMTGDTNLWGQDLCRWADYPDANMPCGWDPQQWVYDPWTGTYY